MAHDEMIKVVKKGVADFATVENALEQATNGITALEDDFHRAGGLGMEKMAKVIRIIHRLRTAKGDLAKVAAEIYDLHDVGTAMAKRNNADIALPEDGFSAFGGGGR